MTASRISTEAWVLNAGDGTAEPGQLIKETITLPKISTKEVLADVIYGCWEGNMTHAISRSPIDVCHLRNEPKVVLGNAGVVRVAEVGEQVTSLKPGDYAFLFCNGVPDQYGYPVKIFGYDAPKTVGLLAKQTTLKEYQLIKISENSRFKLEQWAAFSLRYPTAWANWKLAFACWRGQMTEEDCLSPYVWGWGGGVSIAELSLAKLDGAKVSMLTSDEKRFKYIESLGITPIDRRAFGQLAFDPDNYKADKAYKASYDQQEKAFLDAVHEKTDGLGVAIFIDHIGGPVTRATLKALARQGVITTAGWKHGMKMTSMRAIECISRHIHVHTHYARYAQGVEAARFAEQTGWMPAVEPVSCKWDDIPQLAKEYSLGMPSYFPIYQVNPEAGSHYGRSKHAA